MMGVRFSGIILATAVLAAPAAFAQVQQEQPVSALKGHNSNAPVDVSADRIEVQDRADRAVFTGNVHVTQAELTLDTPRLTVAYAGGSGNVQIKRLDAAGGVVVHSPSETAKGDFGVYDLDRKLITLIGNVQLNRENNQVNGARLVIDLDFGPRGDRRWPARRKFERWSGQRPLHRAATPATEAAIGGAVNEAVTFARPSNEAQQGNGGLEVRSIAKSYDRRAVLHDVSLNVHRGEVVGLLGPNGAGKTTCFYSVMGLVKPDSGRIFLDSQDITELPMYRRAILGLGYLPQETSIFRGMTVEENIMAVLEIAEPDRDARRGRLEQLLGEFGLTALREAAAMALSGGERRRCEIARALAADPSIMLLDEPFAGIDPISIADIRELVRELKSRDIGVLITDHNVRETLDIVDRACIIYDGQVLFAGTPEALVADQEVRRLYLGESFAL